MLQERNSFAQLARRNDTEVKNKSQQTKPTQPTCVLPVPWQAKTDIPTVDLQSKVTVVVRLSPAPGGTDVNRTVIAAIAAVR